uniref:Uncharacterized protein n=1 Tax=Picea glauca TaxID=3330 RepID=A0A101M4W0_PICGL|nr:hypothetical protein ABT39_MTgene788 [Picea glauca]QHR90509.1 hypothetical protein Q903MT_gene4533 [Picea sitchensis]
MYGSFQHFLSPPGQEPVSLAGGRTRTLLELSLTGKQIYGSREAYFLAQKMIDYLQQRLVSRHGGRETVNAHI